MLDRRLTCDRRHPVRREYCVETDKTCPPQAEKSCPWYVRSTFLLKKACGVALSKPVKSCEVCDCRFVCWTDR